MANNIELIEELKSIKAFINMGVIKTKASRDAVNYSNYTGRIEAYETVIDLLDGIIKSYEEA